MTGQHSDSTSTPPGYSQHPSPCIFLKSAANNRPQNSPNPKEQHHADNVQPFSIAQAKQLTERHSDGDAAEGKTDGQPWEVFDAVKMCYDGGDDGIVAGVEEDADEGCDYDENPLVL